MLEGVAYAFKDSYDALKSTGTEIDSLIALGGGSASRYWLEVIATCLGQAIDIPVAGDFGAALGAARLAMMADGAPDDIATRPETKETIEPVGAMTDAFAEGHARYRATYNSLKELS